MLLVSIVGFLELGRSHFFLLLPPYQATMYTHLVSCHAFKLGMSSDQNGRTTRISQLLSPRLPSTGSGQRRSDSTLSDLYRAKSR
jgi:hypothetical protein